MHFITHIIQDKTYIFIINLSVSKLKIDTDLINKFKNNIWPKVNKGGQLIVFKQ